MNILVLNHNWFSEEFQAAGHNVYTCGLFENLDIVLPLPGIHIDSVLKLVPDQKPIDIIVILDNSAPIVISGLEDTEIPIVFYSVDTHHHYNWHRYLCNVCDHVIIAQKDYLPYFQEVGHNPDWLPLWATRYMEASENKKYGAVFVGNLDKKLNPDRVWFFDQLKERTKILCMTGEFWKIFPESEIVINQTVKGDLNFRVFEAMMSGAMLLTEASGNGLESLFSDGQHLVTYKKSDFKEAANKIESYLGKPKLCRQIGIAGREEILKSHTIKHRAEYFLKLLPTIKKKKQPQRYFSNMINFSILGFNLQEIDTAACAQSFLVAMKSIEDGLREGEAMNSQIACHIVLTCFKYDQYLKTGSGAQVLEKIHNAYPDEAVFKVSKLRGILNQGQMDLAQEFALSFSTENPQVTFARAEHFVQMILNGETMH